MCKIILFTKVKGDTVMEKNFSDIQQFEKAVFHYASKIDNLYRTKLNKLLFYTQFYHKKHFDKAYFSNYVFIKDSFGPVLENLDARLRFLETKSKSIKIEPGPYGDVITPIPGLKLADDVCSEIELEVFEIILNKFSNFNSRELSEYSHNEPLWINTRFKDEISIGRANALLDF